VLSAKKRILALNKKDLANPNIMSVSTSVVRSGSSTHNFYTMRYNADADTHKIMFTPIYADVA
jgi:hypothetical protein